MKNMLLTLACLLSFSACYRMPTCDDYSVVPATNNPDITRAQSDMGMPSGSF